MGELSLGSRIFELGKWTVANDIKDIDEDKQKEKTSSLQRRKEKGRTNREEERGRKNEKNVYDNNMNKSKWKLW